MGSAPSAPAPEKTNKDGVADLRGKHSEGKRVPHVVFRTRVRDDTIQPNPFKWLDLTTDEIFKGKKIVLLALPGAFTPTCSSTHLPGYDTKYDEFVKLGVDQVICLSVNDAFVMFQWAKHLGVKNVFMLPDGNGDFTRQMNMLVTKTNLGFGPRSWRYSMYVVDGVIQKQFIEAGFIDEAPEDPFAVSGAETMLQYLTEHHAPKVEAPAAEHKAEAPAAEHKAEAPAAEHKAEHAAEHKAEVPAAEHKPEHTAEKGEPSGHKTEAPVAEHHAEEKHEHATEHKSETPAAEEK